MAETNADGDLVGDQEVATTGSWAEHYGTPSDRLTVAAGYGQDDGGRAYNSAVWGVVHWRPVAPFRVDAE